MIYYLPPEGKLPDLCFSDLPTGSVEVWAGFKYTNFLTDPTDHFAEKG